MDFKRVVISAVCLFSFSTAFAADIYYLRIQARNKYERTKVANVGLSIEDVRSDSVYTLADQSEIRRVQEAGLNILEGFVWNRNVRPDDFPPNDEKFHNYEEMTVALDKLVAAHPNLMRKFSIGQSFLGREIWCIQVNTSNTALRRPVWSTKVSAKPGAIFMANHHAREHVSAEMALMLLQFLGAQYGHDQKVTDLLERRDVYVIPMVNPDGVSFDIATGKYQWQRKNMRPNGTSKPGVDLNRNYGFKWGTGGSSDDPSSEVYMGTAPFSEPETQAIKRFVESRPNVKTLLTYHTFSELILYPWGSTYDPIGNRADLDTYEAMAKTMAAWNGYTPQQSSELYIASGDTTDWAYGTLGIFSFTFELSPQDMWGGGFYPGQDILGRVFDANIRPALYMIELADNPHRAKSFEFRRDFQ